MVDVKMTNILISTSRFLATLTYPVKNKVTQPVSKTNVTLKESIDAVIQVTPIIHHASQLHNHLTAQFYEVLSQEEAMVMTKNKEKQLHEFLELCGEKVREELKQNAEQNALNLLDSGVHTIFVNLLDSSGNLIQSKSRSVQDIVASLTHIRTKLILWQAPKKLPSFLVQPTTCREQKPRRKERNVAKESGTRHYLDFSNKRVA